MFRNGQLIIFDGDWIDRSLPKHAERVRASFHTEEEEDAAMSDPLLLRGLRGRIIMSKATAMSSAPFTRSSRVDWRDLHRAERLQNDQDEIMFARWPLLAGFRVWMRRLFQRRPEDATPVMTIAGAFAKITETANVVTDVNASERIVALQAMIDDAATTGQTDLIQRARRHMSAILAETALLQAGLGRYITEADLISFVRGSPRGLLLTFLSEFPRAIPAEIRERKQRCDALGIFDAYVVLHHDPDRKSWADEEAAALADAEATRQAAEAARAARPSRDPILFGLIHGRRNLYLVGDWIDEVCDLRFEEIVSQLGAARAITTAPVLET